MTLIVTNDDGIDAPGIRALFKAIDGQGILIAPQDEWSGCGHRVTTDQPIQVHRRSPVEYAVGGTPADCTRLAISHLCPDVKIVLSGINLGGNLGVDAYMSGTIAAVREAAMHQIPGIAVSQYRRKLLDIDWDVAAKWTAIVLADLLTRPFEPGTFWNVNLPYLLPGAPEPKIIFCQPSIHPLPINYRQEADQFHYTGDYAKRDRGIGTDVDVCFSGNIAITLLHL